MEKAILRKSCTIAGAIKEKIKGSCNGKVRV